MKLLVRKTKASASDATPPSRPAQYQANLTGMRFALISDEHFGPTAFFQGKLRKLTAQAGELCEAFVQHMNQQVKPDLVVNLGDVIEDESLAKDLEHYGQVLK